MKRLASRFSTFSLEPTGRRGQTARSAAPPSAMFTATFTFAKRRFDAEFQSLDDDIARFARSLPGYLGEESWEDVAGQRISTVYYWDSLESLQRLVDHPAHRVAKQRQGEWLAGYRVTVSQVLRRYGDGGLADAVSPRGPEAGTGAERI